MGDVLVRDVDGRGVSSGCRWEGCLLMWCKWESASTKCKRDQKDKAFKPPFPLPLRTLYQDKCDTRNVMNIKNWIQLVTVLMQTLALSTHISTSLSISCEVKLKLFVLFLSNLMTARGEHVTGAREYQGRVSDFQIIDRAVICSTAK